MGNGNHFWVKQELAVKQTDAGFAVPLVLKKRLLLRKSELQKLPMSLVEMSLPWK